MRPALDVLSQLCIFVTFIFAEFYIILACQIYQTPFIYCVKSVVKAKKFKINAFIGQYKTKIQVYK